MVFFVTLAWKVLFHASFCGGNVLLFSTPPSVRKTVHKRTLSTKALQKSDTPVCRNGLYALDAQYTVVETNIKQIFCQISFSFPPAVDFLTQLAPEVIVKCDSSGVLNGMLSYLHTQCVDYDQLYTVLNVCNWSNGWPISDPTTRKTNSHWTIYTLSTWRESGNPNCRNSKYLLVTNALYRSSSFRLQLDQFCLRTNTHCHLAKKKDYFCVCFESELMCVRGFWEIGNTRRKLVYFVRLMYSVPIELAFRKENFWLDGVNEFHEINWGNNLQIGIQFSIIIIDNFPGVSVLYFSMIFPRNPCFNNQI